MDQLKTMKINLEYLQMTIGKLEKSYVLLLQENMLKWRRKGVSDPIMCLLSCQNMFLALQLSCCQAQLRLRSLRP